MDFPPERVRIVQLQEIVWPNPDIPTLSHRSVAARVILPLLFLPFTRVSLSCRCLQPCQIILVIAVLALFHGENSNQPSCYIPRYLPASHSYFLGL